MRQYYIIIYILPYTMWDMTFFTHKKIQG